MKRINLNVEGFDKLITGGVPIGDAILVSGLAGTGKTVLSLSMVLGQEAPAIFLTLEESQDQLIEDAQSLGLDLEKRIKSGKLRVIKYDPYRLQDLNDMLKSNIGEMGAGFVVIDSVSALLMHIHDDAEVRRIILDLVKTMRNKKATSVLISEATDESHRGRFGVEEFVTDVVIAVGKKEDSRYIKAVKCRASEHAIKALPMSISSNGIKIG